MNVVTFSGCNLSPLLFSIYINDLCSILNKSGLGVTLGNTSNGDTNNGNTNNVSCLLFADDVVLVGRNQEALNTLIDRSRLFFKSHKLKISDVKSKVLLYDGSSGNLIFPGSGSDSSLNLGQVLAFKYLGVQISAPVFGLFKDYNVKVKQKANNYLASTLSLVRSGPDRSDLAFTLWTSVALPSILYGCEVMPLTLTTIKEVERCQSAVGKFILQLPRSTANVVSNIDAGLRPVWSVIAEKVLLYAQKVMRKPASSLAKIAMSENMDLGVSSPYTKYLIKWKTDTDTFGLPAKSIKSAVTRAATADVFQLQRAASTSTFAMNTATLSATNQWFRPKAWVNDSVFSRIISQFRGCNLGLGNRGPAKDGHFYKLCPLCSKNGKDALNNEVCRLKIIK